MKRKYLYLIVIVSMVMLTKGKAQINLVPNGSFEIVDTCIMSQGTIYRAVGWNNCIWDAEYFNACANLSQASYGVPNNENGHQNAQDGVAYSLLELYIYGDFPNGGEVMGRLLSQPLDTSKTYYCSFYVVRTKIGSQIGINKIGMKFSTVPHGCEWCTIAPLNNSLINNTAAIYSNNIIYDTVYWTQISGWYKPDSAYNYIMLGNFFDTAHISYYPSNLGNPVYYFDNIYVGLDSVSNYHEGVPDINSIENKISIYPNPATTTLTIHSSNELIENLELYSMVGKLIYAESVGRKYEVNIAVANIKQGIYFMKVLTAKNNTVQKIQIIH